MLLPYILTRGAIADDDAGIAESGNGIPDILDEARFEVDYWLRLRDGKEYGSGLTNPNSNNEFFQAGPSAVAAWANAANAAMLADAFRIAGQAALAEQYKTAAVEAYGVAGANADQLLDKTMDAGGATFRGRDLKMTAAAFLYNVTGEQTYEDVVKAESVCTTATSEVSNTKLNQLWTRGRRGGRPTRTTATSAPSRTSSAPWSPTPSPAMPPTGRSSARPWRSRRTGASAATRPT
jgi:endoglucanase